ncbi:MAG: trigger factor [Prolixibacteraceae bacterium]
MNITRENKSEVNAVIKVEVEKQDYAKSVEDTLKDYRRKASIPGFRPGKVPVGLIKKRFGKAILIEEVNKLLSQSLSKYLVDEKLKILGEPMPNKEQQKEIDWESDDNFEFAFDIGMAPDVEVSLDENDKLPFYKIKVSDEMIDQQIEQIKTQMGQNTEAEEVKDNGLVRGDFVQLDETGEPLEGGIQPEGVLLSMDLMKDDDIKKEFMGKKQGDEVVFNPVKAYENRHEIGHMLNIGHEEAEELDSNFKFTINEVLEFKKAELNEELYKKIYGEDTEIKTEEDLRERIKAEFADNLVHSSNHKFTLDTRDALVEKTEIPLPEEFLKRWLREANENVTEEQIENDFDGFVKDLRWQLIKDEIIKGNELKAEPGEATEFARQLARAQYSQYGIFDVPEEQLDAYAKMILEKPEEKEKIYKKLLEDKVIDVVKGKVTVEEKEISQEEFNQMMN